MCGYGLVYTAEAEAEAEIDFGTSVLKRSMLCFSFVSPGGEIWKLRMLGLGLGDAWMGYICCFIATFW